MWKVPTNDKHYGIVRSTVRIPVTPKILNMQPSTKKRSQTNSAARKQLNKNNTRKQTK